MESDISDTFHSNISAKSKVLSIIQLLSLFKHFHYKKYGSKKYLINFIYLNRLQYLNGIEKMTY